MQAFGMSNLRYTYCFRTRQNQDAARPTRFPDHGASRKGQSRAACSLVSLPTFRRYQGTAEDHGQDCGAIQKVRRYDSGPGEKDRFLSLIFATALLPLLRIFWISGLQQTLCLRGLERVQNKSLGCNRLRYRKNASQHVPTTNCVGYNPTLSAIPSKSGFPSAVPSGLIEDFAFALLGDQLQVVRHNLVSPRHHAFHFVFAQVRLGFFRKLIGVQHFQLLKHLARALH